MLPEQNLLAVNVDDGNPSNFGQPSLRLKKHLQRDCWFRIETRTGSRWKNERRLSAVQADVSQTHSIVIGTSWRVRNGAIFDVEGAESDAIDRWERTWLLKTAKCSYRSFNVRLSTPYPNRRVPESSPGTPRKIQRATFRSWLLGEFQLHDRISGGPSVSLDLSDRCQEHLATRRDDARIAWAVIIIEPQSFRKRLW